MKDGQNTWKTVTIHYQNVKKRKKKVCFKTFPYRLLVFLTTLSCGESETIKKRKKNFKGKDGMQGRRKRGNNGEAGRNLFP